jgi:endonuclease/exonuclease/phosphatase (EEP) superfamily protein YafD
MSSRRLEQGVAGGLAAWAIARLTSADRFAVTEAWIVPWLAFTPYAAVAAAAGTLIMRDRTARAVSGLAGLTLAGLVAPRTLPRRQPQPTGPVLRVITANLLGGRADAGAVLSLVRETRADVLFVQDLDHEVAARFERAGISELLSWQIISAVVLPRGGGIYARYPLSGGRAATAASAAQCSARLTLPSGHCVQLTCVHAPPPKPWNPDGATRWRGELAMLPGPDDPPVILAGDFNATLDHLQLRRLLCRGYADAARQAGHGLAPTWGPRPGLPPVLLALDHVLIDPRCAVHATSAHRLAGSDHHALYAEVRLPG